MTNSIRSRLTIVLASLLILFGSCTALVAQAQLSAGAVVSASAQQDFSAIHRGSAKLR